jgi:hypothetical protein
MRVRDSKTPRFEFELSDGRFYQDTLISGVDDLSTLLPLLPLLLLLLPAAACCRCCCLLLAGRLATTVSGASSSGRTQRRASPLRWYVYNPSTSLILPTKRSQTFPTVRNLPRLWIYSVRDGLAGVGRVYLCMQVTNTFTERGACLVRSMELSTLANACCATTASL